MTFNGRTATSFVMFAIFVGACAMASQLPQKAAFMPLLIGVPGALLCLAQLGMDLFRKGDTVAAASKPAIDADTDSEQRAEAEVFLWLALFSVALIGFGFTVGGPLVVTGFVRAFSRESWLNAVFAGVGTLAVVYGVFVWLLELPLFQGLVLEALF